MRLFPFPYGKGLGVRFPRFAQQLRDLLFDVFDHRLDIVQRLVWNPDDPHSLPRDRFRAQLVILPLLFMRFPIYFDREFHRITIKIDDKPFDHLLTAEMKTIQRISPKSSPERAFRRSHLTAESLRERKLFRPNILTADDLAASVHEPT